MNSSESSTSLSSIRRGSLRPARNSAPSTPISAVKRSKRSSVIRPAMPSSASSTSLKSSRPRSSGSDKSSPESNIKVFVRCRGRNKREVAENSSVVLSTSGLNGKEVNVQANQYSTKTYNYDGVFGPESDQEMVYNQVAAEALEEMLSGFNCTIFAYGQTGTGKTHTMTGNLGISGDNGINKLADDAGIIPRILYHLFESLDKTKGTGLTNNKSNNTKDHSVKVSYIELYNEELRDLISEGNVEDEKKIKMYDDTNNKGSIVYQGMEEAFLQNYQQGLDILRHGAAKRQVASTKCNDMSSRSHSVFTITLHVKETDPGGQELVRVGKLNLVDLAGSENINRSGAEKKNAREAGIINQSLLTLGRVINALVESPTSHVPYRESKLTRILQDSLGGKTKTCIVATVTPAKFALDETLSTLEYASRAKNIKNKPQANQTMSKQAHFGEFVAEIERLRADLNATRKKDGVFLSQESYQQLVDESESRKILVDEQKMRLDAVEMQLKELKEQSQLYGERIQQAEDNLKEANDSLKNTQSELADSKAELVQYEKKLNHTKQQLAEEASARRDAEEYNKVLKTAGAKLIDDLGQATEDVNKLHGKVRRNKTTIDANHQVIDLFKKQVSIVVKDIGEYRDGFTKKAEHTRSNLLDKVNQAKKDDSEHTKDSWMKLEEAFTRTNVKREGAKENIGSASAQLNSLLQDKIQTEKDKMVESFHSGREILNDSISALSAGIEEEIQTLKSELSNEYSKMKGDIFEVLGLGIGVVERQHEDIAELKRKLREYESKSSAELDLQKARFADMIHRQKKESEMAKNQFEVSMQELINKVHSQYENHLQESLQVASNEYEATKSRSESFIENAQEIGGRIEEHNSEVNGYLKNCGLEDSVAKLVVSTDETSKKVASAAKDGTDSIKDLVCQQASTVDQLSSVLNDNIASIAGEMGTEFAALGKEVQEIGGELKPVAETCLEDIVDTIDKGSDMITLSVNDEMVSLIDYYNEASNQIREKLTESEKAAVPIQPQSDGNTPDGNSRPGYCDFIKEMPSMRSISEREVLGSIDVNREQ